MEYEWKTFHSDILSNLKPNAQIVTYTQGIDTVQFPRVLRYIQNFEYSSKDRLLEFALAFFQKQQNGQFHHLAVSQKMAQNNTIIYNSAFNGEFELLRIRARRSYALDIQAISYVKKHMNRKKFNVLVLGCAYGFVAETRFGLDDDIENVICVDKNPEVIEKAKVLYRNYPHMKFLVADVLSDNYVLEIKRELEKMSITGIDFMFTSDTFRYLTNPRTAIRNTRKLLQSDGMVIIRDSDDSNKLAYPDNGGYLSDIVEYSAKALEMPNYYIGRELPLLLLNSGFSISDIRIDLRTTINMTYEEKEEFFLSTLGSRRSIAKQVMASTTNSKAELETIISSVDKLENCFYGGDFWYSESNLIFIAKRS